MPVWGRNAVAGLDGMQPKRHGRTSIILALLALALVVASGADLVSLPTDAPENTEGMALNLLLGAYFVVAPALHVIGFGYGIAGLVTPGSGKVSSVIGILLNILLVLMGIGFGYFAASGIGAFT